MFNQNNKIQEEFNINKHMQGENQNLRMNNANMHGEIQNLRMNNVNIAQEHDENIAAMGSDMAKVIHRYKRLKRKYRRRNNYHSSKLLQSGDGLNHRKLIQYLKNKYQPGNGIRHNGLKYL